MRIRRSTELIYTFLMRLLGGIIIIIAISITGCGGSGEDSEEPLATAQIMEPTPISTPTLITSFEETPAIRTVRPHRIDVWIARQFSPQSDIQAGAILSDQIASFQASHPDLDVNVESKPPVGPGGTLDYLRSGGNIAPDVLPDLIMLPSDYLEMAAREGLVYPLDDLLNEEMIDDLFPAARAMSQVEGVTFGYPFALTNLHHFVFDEAAIADELPSTWNELLEVEDAKMAIPGAGDEGAEMVLQFYMAAGGSLSDETDQPRLEVEPLIQALSPFSRGSTRRVLLRQSSDITTVDQAWQFFVDGDVNVVLNEASSYFKDRRFEPDSSPSGVPGFDSALRPFVKGWVWAISTPDPEKQALAVEMLISLSSGINSGEWSLIAGQLPARRSAYSQWPSNDPLTIYLQQASEHAHQFPVEASPKIIEALSDALIEVITLSKSPSSAAEDAAQSIG
jgi:ABC-type glycerol-3-phosphate transport system substrate-binding protein